MQQIAKNTAGDRDHRQLYGRRRHGRGRADLVAVVLFAFSTMLSWSYYGAKSWTYLFGESRSMDLLLS